MSKQEKKEKTYKVQFEVSFDEKDQVESMVKDAGFSSLPAAMKYVFTQMKNENINLGYGKRPVVYLTEQQTNKLLAEAKEFDGLNKQGKVKSFESVDELMKALDED